MNMLSATMLRNNLSDAISEISDTNSYLLVTKKGKITSALGDIDLFEDLIALSNKKYVLSIKKARQEYKDGKTFTHSHLFGEI